MVEELFTYWNLDQTDDELEQLEELLIVSRTLLMQHAVILSSLLHKSRRRWESD